MSTATTSRRYTSPHRAPVGGAPRIARVRQLTGTRRLVRLAARRDRVVLPVWLLAMVGLLVATVVSLVGLYGTEAERTQYAVVAAGNVVARMFDGPMSGTSLGAIVMTEAFGFLALLAGIMSAQAVVRHTRLEEETGRAELVGSAVVGRHARLVAALIVVTAANLTLAVSVTAVLAVSGLPGRGAVLAGAALAAVGLTFAAVAAVAAQVAHTARGANGLAVGAVGVAFLLRAIGDALGTVADSGVEVISAWPSWLSPIGWGQQVRPFGGDHAGVLLLFVAATTGLVWAAFVLTRHRDVGRGMLPTRPGPDRASARLTSPAGLAWRLQRGAMLGWAIGITTMGVALGAISDEVEELLATSDELAAMLGELGVAESLFELYVAFAIAVLAYAVAAFHLQSLLRVRTEERAGRAEPVLATRVSRHRFLGAHVAWSILGAALLLVLLGSGGGVSAGLATGRWGTDLGDWMLAAIVHLPAILVIGGIVVVAIGWLPRFAVPIAWAVLISSLVLGQFGGLLDLPPQVMDLSPFLHVPPVPAEPVRTLPLLTLSMLAAGLHLVGFLGWRRRDLTT